MSEDERGRMVLLSDVDTDATRAAVGRTLAAIEDDCSGSWPACPRASLICDCRLRATRAVNALKMHLKGVTGT